METYGRYQAGTIVMRSSGYTVVSTKDRGQVAEHRLIMEHIIGRDLELGEKVVHLDNTLRGINPKAFNDQKNLALVKCRTTKWIGVKCRVLYEPTKRSFPTKRLANQSYSLASK